MANHAAGEKARLLHAVGLHLPDAAVAIIGGGIAAAYAIGLPIALLVYDLVPRRGRPHTATAIALAAYYSAFFSPFMFANAPAVQAAIRALE